MSKSTRISSVNSTIVMATLLPLSLTCSHPKQSSQWPQSVANGSRGARASVHAVRWQESVGHLYKFKGAAA